MDELHNKEIKNKAQVKIDDICAALGDGQNSLLQILVKGYRKGAISPDKAQEVFNAVRACLGDAEANYHAAIAQPEPKAQLTRRVVL